MDWANVIGAAWRGNILGVGNPAAEERVFAGSGNFMPQSQAQMSGSPITGAQGGWGILEGFISGTLLGGSIASDRPQALSQ